MTMIVYSDIRIYECLFLTDMLISNSFANIRIKPFTIFFIVGLLIFYTYFNKVIAETHYNHMTKYPVDFSLSFSHSNLDLDTGNDTYSINQRRISASLLHIESPSLRAGFNLGNSYIGLDNDVATSGLNLNGNHIGFNVEGTTGTNPRLGLNAQYLYQELKGTNSLRTVTLSWLEWHTDVSLEIDLGTFWTLYTAAGIVDIEANRRVSGDINNTLKLKQDAGFQGRLGMYINTYPDGKVSITINRGIYNGSQLSFAREF